MTTRATYAFIRKDCLPTLTLYIHSDGYPEGAAEYFKNACLSKNARGGMIERFIRANDRAELTSGHDSHGDTEYRYTLEGDRLTADYRRPGTSHWARVYAGDLLGFIEAKAGVKLLALPGQWLDHDGANELLELKLTSMNDAISAGWTGNASSYANDAWHLMKQIVRRFGQDTATLHAIKVIDLADEFFAKAYGWSSQLNVDETEALNRWRESFREGRENFLSTRSA